MADRAVLARRAAESGRTAARPSTGPVSTNLLARDLTEVNTRSYAGRHKNRRPGSDKGQGMWRTSPHYRTVATIDPRWTDRRTA